MVSFLVKPMSDEESDDLIKDLIPWYLSSELENVALLETALSERNFALLIEDGDKMYGHGQSYGFPLISTLGKRIEIAAIQQDIYLLSRLIASLKSYIQECIKKLNKDLNKD
jgi:HPt (histidine-containing phosphotransfer) domain-containing protein